MTRRSMRRRALACLAGVLALALVAIAPTAGPTDAAWADHERAGATFSAATMPTPEGRGSPACSARNVLLVGGRLTINWKVPDGEWPLPEGAAEYTVADVEYGREVGGLLNPILDGLLLSGVTTTRSGNDFTTVVAGGLLTNVLGGTMRFGIRLKGPGGWASEWLVADATFPALVGIGTCTLS